MVDSRCSRPTRWRSPSRWRCSSAAAGCFAGCRRISRISCEHRGPGMTTSLLALDGIGKDYAKVETRGGRLRLVFDLLRGHGAAHVFRALDDVSFTMARGESLGIIGENGAGKSTLLKVVAGVIQPTRGRVTVNGRVGALLELGSGFHPEYTGLAN